MVSWPPSLRRLTALPALPFLALEYLFEFRTKPTGGGFMRNTLRTLLFVLLPVCAWAQTAPWSTTLRGSWVETGSAQGSVIVAGKSNPSEIVVGGAENSIVRQAAQFLAADLEKISGAKVPIVQTPTTGRSAIRMVTLGNDQIPAAVNTRGMQGQWES